MDVRPLDPLLYRPLIERALREDLGLAGDVTTAAVVPADSRIEARLTTRQDGRLAGLPIALDVFRQLDPEIEIETKHQDGADLTKGDVVAVLKSRAQPILTGERTALNILTHLCGVATATRQAVEAVKPYPTKVACTRKTTPGLRALEKYAVRAGGGVNHRFGLFDAVMIKDNHIVAAGGLRAAIDRAKRGLGHMVKIEVEIDSLEQLDEALAMAVDAVLLDNMSPDQIKQAVDLVGGRAITEASGGIRPDTVRDYAAAGVDIVSLGWLTHSVPVLDIGLDFIKT